ncbi:ABC transporter substrate-binding protein [Sporichthya sp.]|uniref:ABC transporter substrate-binding protein n=1 Tax=Sporichthya sp. TaxID=65475 RepID=UPI0017C08BB5|nr:ABC transporter substrate-binding protein [Sporichthya sp.]MBA3743420.1 ABC transporter substrate-binding protein [Sporichthya sp.]
MRRTASLTAAALVAVLALAACGSDDESTATAALSAADGVKTGPGVTDSTITLGVLTDLSGVFKDFGNTANAGHQIWLDEVNAAGGICGRQVKLDIRDHGYKADTAKLIFPEQEAKVAAFLDLLGSPVVAALRQDLKDAQSTAVVGSFSSILLDNPYLLLPSTSYDIDMINGLAYLLKQKIINAGDTVGHVYLEGELGLNGLAGSQYFAKQHGIKLKPVKVLPTDTDMTAVVTNLRGVKVDALALSTSPTQTTSIATAAKALGLKVPMIGNFPSFVPQLLATPAADALSKMYLVGSIAPFSSTVPKARAVSAAYEAGGYEFVPNLAVQLGYEMGELMAGVLENACAAKDLTRAGIQAALTRSTKVDTQGLSPKLDYSKPGFPPARESYVAQVDATQKGGMRQLDKLSASPDAKSYVAPHQAGH